MPYYNSAIGKLWLERGGTSVTANIRGGGEFGTPWHEAGRGAGKRLSHDDFAAVAADLVRRGVTRPGRIAAEGGSNGGILISNMLTRYPERFGALFCTIPLIDMRRYSKLLAGASWIAEYGDPDKPEEWAWLKTYSAYHQAVPGRPYPPILIATTRRDDRVHPGHARKMAAKLQAMGYEDVWFYEPPPEATATARTTRSAPLSRRSATPSCGRRSAGAEPAEPDQVRDPRERDGRHAGADQQAAADLVDDADRPRIADEAAGAGSDQRVAEGIGEGQQQERRLEHQHLGQKVGVRVEEGRQEGHEEGDALGVERRHQPGMAQHPGGRHRVGARGRLQRAAGPPELDPEIHEIGRADPFQDR